MNFDSFNRIESSVYMVSFAVKCVTIGDALMIIVHLAFCYIASCSTSFSKVFSFSFAPLVIQGCSQELNLSQHLMILGD